MSDSVKAAAANLRKLIEDIPGHAELWNLDHIRIARIIVDQFLAEHPADDDEPITRIWLAGIFGEPQRSWNNEWIWVLGSNEVTTVVAVADLRGLWAKVGDRKLRPLETKGDLRRLCSALGIPLSP